MKIGVISDTHSRKLPQQMMDDFKKVEFIIHVGDFCDMSVYETLTKMKEVKAVYGNMDDSAICKRVPRRQIVTCGHLRIGLFHGEGATDTLLNKMKAEFQGDHVDAVIFGHSHQPLNEKIDNVLYFNPGSPTDDMFAPYCSYGLLEVVDKGIKGKIVKVKR